MYNENYEINSERMTVMDNTFHGIELIKQPTAPKYHCGKGCEMLLFGGCTRQEFDRQCEIISQSGNNFYTENEIKGNIFRTYVSNKPMHQIHAYYCENEGKMRIVADPNGNIFAKSPESCPVTHPTTLWQFEIDHSLIDCGMCLIIRCCDGSFFIIDSAHMYSVNDDIRIIEFLKKQTGGRKPVVSGWFFSHAHEDHVCKFLDIVEYHRNEIEIEKVYYNFPAADNKDNIYWGECGLAVLRRFETVMAANPDIKCINLHSGQRFYVRNLEFTVLCTHEDVYPKPFEDFNNTSTALMLSVDGSKVLLPGDCSVESDRVMVPRWGDYLKCDVVQVSHHGHTGTSPEFYRLADAECALFAVTEIKYDEEYPRQESNRVAVGIAKEYYIASNGAVEIPLPYKYGNTKVYPDETFEDFNGIFQLWTYEYTDEYKQKLYREFLERSGR